MSNGDKGDVQPIFGLAWSRILICPSDAVSPMLGPFQTQTILVSRRSTLPRSPLPVKRQSSEGNFHRVAGRCLAYEPNPFQNFWHPLFRFGGFRSGGQPRGYFQHYRSYYQGIVFYSWGEPYTTLS